MCQTRWVERHDAFEVFINLFLATISCLEEIGNSSPSDWKRETRSDAQSFLVAMSQFSFFVSLVTTQKVLLYTRGLSVKLQGHYVDVAHSHRDIGMVKNAFKKSRANVDTFHNPLYEQVMVLSQSINIVESVPRLASRQQLHQNTPASSPKEY